jgi:hypothetical protein
MRLVNGPLANGATRVRTGTSASDTLSHWPNQMVESVFGILF